MIDISDLGYNFRGYPVTIISEGAARALNCDIAGGMVDILRAAKDTAEPDEPSGWIFEADLGDTVVWIERFGGIRDLSRDRHEGGQWSVYLPSER